MSYSVVPLARLRTISGAAAIVAIAAISLAGCRRQPAVSDAAYREAVVAFYTGLAALETSQEVLAREQLDRVIAVAPQEPAAWADLGLLLLRQQELDHARERLIKAASLAPDNADIQRLLGLTESRRGNLPDALRAWQRALQVRPGDAKAAFALALDQERDGSAGSLAEAQRTFEGLAQRTGNLAAQLESARIAARRGDAAALQRTVAALAGTAASWPDDIKLRFQSLQQAASSDPRAAGQSIAFLKNVLLQLPAYRRALADVSTPRAEVGEPIGRLLVLPNPPPGPAPLDESLTFAVQSAAGLPDVASSWIGAVSLTGDGRPVLAASNGNSIRLSNGTAWSPTAGTPHTSSGPAALPGGVLAVDLNYDFKTDLVLFGSRGLSFLRQGPDGKFADVSAASKLSAAALAAPAAGLWAADIDTDGDLDIVEALIDGSPRILRNNGDGTFETQQPFGTVARARGFVWADLDGDGVPDAALLDASGVVHVFINGRGGSFRESALPTAFPSAVAIGAAEVTGDSLLDILALTAEGAVVALWQSPDAAWTSREIARSPSPPAGLAVGAAGLVTADLDNNGAVDIVVSGQTSSSIVLRGAGSPGVVLGPLAMDVRAAVDIDGDGRLDLIGVQQGGRPAVARSRGARSYHWQVFRPHAATATGDQRINSFGIGGELEVRTGLHAQTYPIDGPLVHVGLGDATRSDVVRILWPNGTLQSEFNVPGDGSIAATQRLKGSCPWLFAWNGREMAFATDVLWRSPLGLRINAQTTADVVMTEDWVRLRGEQLQPRDGFYDLRITAELWETHFFDLASLLVVDHPAGTEVFVDERFAIPAPRSGITVTGPLQPVGAAKDESGRDVSAIVRERDDRYLDSAGRGAYQGVTSDHSIEIDIPDGAPRTGPLWLIAQGWIHPTDSSINVALGQGAHQRPRGLALEVADAAGRFRMVRPDLGFPAGKDKSILIDLAGLFAPTGPRRARLSTNMEIYWDRLAWAVGRPAVAVTPRRIPLGSAELRYRGYSRTEQHDASSPERPRYIVEGTTPRWLDLEGYYTRFGEVRDLLLDVDDRYVIMNAGDELLLRYPAAAPVEAGMARDFVMVTDGWEKDGDFNTTFSRTVLPLPTHRDPRYDRAPRRLEDDPTYRRHTGDFATYHTRYVTPDAVREALRQPDGGGK